MNNKKKNKQDNSKNKKTAEEVKSDTTATSPHNEQSQDTQQQTNGKKENIQINDPNTQNQTQNQQPNQQQPPQFYYVQMTPEQLQHYQQYCNQQRALWEQQQKQIAEQQKAGGGVQGIVKLDGAVGVGIFELIRWYFYFLLAATALVAIYQEVYTKGTFVQTGIRHYLGQINFIEYSNVASLDEPFTDDVDICDFKEYDLKRFFQEYVSQYKPCLFKGYGQTWPAYGKWNNETYLKEVAADEIIYAERQTDNRFAYFTEGARRVYMTYGEFLDKFSEPNRTYHYYYSFEDPPGTLKDDIINPPLMDGLFELKKVTYWHGYGTHTKPHTDAMENMMCVFEGYKNFTIVPPHDREYVYAGWNGLPNNYSPIEFLTPDLEKYPLFAKARVRTVHIGPGDCLYMPAYWWHQVASAPGVSIGVATWYGTSHSSEDVVEFAMQHTIA